MTHLVWACRLTSCYYTCAIAALNVWRVCDLFSRPSCSLSSSLCANFLVASSSSWCNCRAPHSGETLSTLLELGDVQVSENSTTVLHTTCTRSARLCLAVNFRMRMEKVLAITFNESFCDCFCLLCSSIGDLALVSMKRSRNADESLTKRVCLCI